MGTAIAGVFKKKQTKPITRGLKSKNSSDDDEDYS
jgi:hypothetical protein